MNNELEQTLQNLKLQVKTALFYLYPGEEHTRTSKLSNILI